MRTLLQSLAENPFIVAVLAMAAVMAGAITLKMLQIRRGMPMILFVCLFFFLMGASSFAPAKMAGKDVLRWPALAVLAGTYMFYLNRSRGLLGGFTRIHWGFLAFIVLALFSCAYSNYPLYTAERVISIFLLFLAAFVAVWTYANDVRSVYGVVDTIVKLAAVVLVLDYLTIALPGIGAFNAGRFRGFFDNANGNGTFFAIMLPLFLWRYHYERRRRYRHLYLGLLGFAIISVVLSGSRGAIIASFLGGLITQARLDKSKLVVAFAMGILLAAGVMLTRLGVEELRAGAGRLARAESVGTLTHRVDMWREAWPYFESSPLVGIGFGTSRFVLLSSEEAETASSTIGATAAPIHSEHVEMLVEMGVVGYAFLIGFFACMGARGVNTLRQRRGPLQDLGVALSACILAVFCDTILHSWLLSAGNSQTVMFWIIVVLLLRVAGLTAMADRSLARPRVQMVSSSAGKPPELMA
jgi:O-antigen ligase